MNEITFKDWLIKNYEGKVPAGGGLWCNMHIILMVTLALWLIICFFVFKKYKTFAKRFTYVLCYVMLISRLIRMLLLMFVAKQTFIEVWPWQLCHILAFVFPIYYFTKSKFFVLPVLMLTFFGGILTFVFGDYYQYVSFSFLDIESIGLHFMMPTVVLGALCSNTFKVELSKIWQLPIALVLLVSYASIGNAIVDGANFMYLKENGLPFNFFPGYSHIYTYLIIGVILIVLFLLPFIIVYAINKHKKKLELALTHNINSKRATDITNENNKQLLNENNERSQDYLANIDANNLSRGKKDKNKNKLGREPRRLAK